jgi:hypothetical protein
MQALSATALAIAWNIFPLAIPLVNLDITLSRAEARTGRKRKRRKQKIAPEGANSAVRFAHDSDTQNYVELEGGGKDRVRRAGAGRPLRAVLVGRADLQAG